MSNAHRRQFLCYSSAVAVASLIIPTGRATAGLRPSCGCCYRGGSFAPGQSGVELIDSGLATNSGDPTTDRFLGRALLRLATMFEVKPGFLFFDDPDAQNAYASHEALIPDTVGTVLMGKRFFSQHMRLDDDGMTIIAVCAHEFGHIRQIRTGLIDVLGRLDKTVRPIELHADYLAGAFLAARKKDYPNLNLQAAGKTFVKIGDNDFASRSHHGTAEERIAAMTAGYDFVHGGSDDINQIAKAGLAFVKRVL